ncbi:MAG: iron ABC transporter permease [Parvularculaceae bacterium]|nr:iron ABC transporter permease [Parvularculaceae bacterium]
MTLRMLTVLIAFCLAAFFASLFAGPAPIAPIEALKALFGAGDPRHVLIIQEIRAPRALAALCVGAALGAAGAALQGLLRNPLADPGVLGVSSGAALFAVASVYFGLSASLAFATPAAAMTGALATTALLYALGASAVSTERLVLVGVGLSSACGALTALVMNLAPNPFVLSDLVNWLFGAVANRSFDDVATVAPFLLAGGVLLAAHARGLSALALGEETAGSLGADLVRLRLAVVLGTALLVGAAVSLAGAVGFVGIVAPHLARPLARHDPARLLLPSALIGAAILMLADLVIRLLPFAQELKLGVAAALFGAPAFIWIAVATRRITA